ncbi:hypothetical protein STEG23_027895, partial [Scotinomys teguina]
MCQLSWFLDPGGWSKTAAVRLYFIFPEICTLSLATVGLLCVGFKTAQLKHSDSSLHPLPFHRQCLLQYPQFCRDCGYPEEDLRDIWT